MRKKIKLSGIFLSAIMAITYMAINTTVIYAAEEDMDQTVYSGGGGYAVTNQLPGVGYTTKLYDSSNGLPTSDANCIFSASDGYIWVGGYSGVFKYDGDTFERQDSTTGLTNGRVFFEDSDHRIWVGTNDNGVVVMGPDGNTHITYKEGLPSSSIRGFGQSPDGNIWVGTTSGVVYVDREMGVHQFEDDRLINQYVLRMAGDAQGRVYGTTRNGDAFCIEDGAVSVFMSGKEEGIGNITAIYADDSKDGFVYLGGEGDTVYYGSFGDPINKYKKISIYPLDGINCITSACGRIWFNSNLKTGYLDERGKFRVLSDIPMNNAIEMMVPDYQGNLWYASSRQGVMKIVSSNFRNLTEAASLSTEAVNTTCRRNGMLYIGTDKGLQIIDDFEKPVTNELTEYIGTTRIRCIIRDRNDNIWLCTYNDDKGVICYTPGGEIISYTEKEGLINNAARCALEASDGSILVGTNGGLSVIKNGKVTDSVGEAEGMVNTVLLTIEEGADGTVYAGTDGDGLYVVDGHKVNRLGRDDGLTSDVILRVKKDVKRDVYWLITSNSIEYMRNGKIRNVETFPYNNNFDVYYDDDDELWILSSYGVYCVKAADVLEDKVEDYRLYNTSNGLPTVPTSNAFSELDDDGTLYISGRTGVSSVNINHFHEMAADILLGVRYISCSKGLIEPDASGTYTIPADAGRITIVPAILDYTMSNPTVRVFLEGNEDSGITAAQSDLAALEYTGLRYGNYNLHIQVVDPANGTVYQDKAFNIVKKPQFMELIVVKILLLALLALLAGLIVWRVMTGTIIRRQYEQIRAAKDEAERANTAKSRFLANISHEIRTPINTIMGMDEMILREEATDVPKGYFLSIINYALDIRNASESLLGLINDLLDMSKIESGKMHLVEQEYETEDLFRSIVSMIRVRSTQKDLTFDVKIDETLPKRLYGDAGKIKQVTLNLLTNAVKYTEVGGFVLRVFVAEKVGEECSLRISVKDTGIGVKKEDLDKLFTAYERLDEEKNSAIQGTGLGLDISRRFAELMDGKLWCESEYGKGSEFIFTFKQKIVDEEGIGKFNEHAEDAVKGPYVPKFIAPDAEVLVVDDNPMNLNVIKGLLKATKVFVTTAESGEECLEKLRYGTFNVVLLDHMMPGMDGLETMARIREKYPDLPVYALTANATSGGNAFYKSKGFTGYLAKPIDSAALENAIMKHLPEEIMMKPAETDAVAEPDTLPDDKLWIEDVEGIHVEEGIKNSGGVSAFIFSLNLFLDTIDGNAEVIENAYDNGDIRLYTVKVHALKSSLRIIGATELSALAQQLEDAGNKEDMDFINENSGRLMSEYKAFKDKLVRLHDKGDAPEKEMIPDEELRDAYAALEELVPLMDYDSVEMVIAQLKEYRLPEEDSKLFEELERKLKSFDWDGMKIMIEGRKH